MRVAWLSFGFVEYCVPIANALTEHVPNCFPYPVTALGPDPIEAEVRKRDRSMRRSWSHCFRKSANTGVGVGGRS